MNGSGETESSMAYDSDGRLTTVNNTSFVYDYQGRVVKATRSDGSISYYPNPEYDVLVKPSGDETSTAHILSGWRRGFVLTDTVNGQAQTPKARYLQTDHLGSVIAVLDSDGSVLTTYTYDAYGRATVSGNDTSRYTFSGKEEFEGLYYFGARFYDPKVRLNKTFLKSGSNFRTASPICFFGQLHCFVGEHHPTIFQSIHIRSK